MTPRATDRFAFDQDLAFIGCFQADDVLEQHAFAAAARAHDDEDFAALDLEVDALEHRHAGVALAQAADLRR